MKENRLASGAGLTIWEGLDWAGAAAIGALWLVCLFISVMKLPHWRHISLGLIANVTLILTFVLVGLASNRLLAGEISAERVSLGAGFWLTIAGLYILIFASRERLGDQRFWRNLIPWSGLTVVLILLFSGWMNSVSIIQEFKGYEQRFIQELIRHIQLSGTSVIAGAFIGIPLGVWATRNKYAEKPILLVTGMVQTVPSLALFGFLIAPLSALSFAYPALRDIGIRGVGLTPAIIALTIYSLLPIVSNTYVGIRQVDPSVIESGLGMGMNRWQVFRRVEMPLATPLILEGVRTASVQAVGLATVAALIGAGGLGWFVFGGIGQAAPDLIVLGAIPVIILALFVDAAMRAIVKLSKPKGSREESQ
jgi:osmoprotectant transport system permease protein